MLIHKNIFLFCIRHMCIYLSCTNRAMPKHFLDIPDIYILFQQKCGKRMSEHMWSDMLADSGKLRIAVYHEPDRLIRQLMMQSVYKEVSTGFNVLLKGFLIQLQGGKYFRAA